MPLPAAPLRQQWKLLLAAHGLDGEHPNATRMHRVCKWLEHGQALRAAGFDDMAFAAYWIGFNALYAQWNTGAKEDGLREHQQIRHCIEALVAQDGEDFLAAWVPLDWKNIQGVYSNPFLSHWYWVELGRGHQPAPEAYNQGHSAVFWRANRRNLVDLLADLFSRVYVLRNQIFHGGATPGSSFNREQMNQVMPLMENFLTRVVQVILHADNPGYDWGSLPYPPVKAD